MLGECLPPRFLHLIVMVSEWFVIPDTGSKLSILMAWQDAALAYTPKKVAERREELLVTCRPNMWQKNDILIP